MFQLFLIFEAVWRSRNLKHLYIFLKKAILQPPCWCYGGDSFRSTGRHDSVKGRKNSPVVQGCQQTWGPLWGMAPMSKGLSLNNPMND